ncbi:MAG: potassium/proton antiporter [Cytophagales bacterium]|nr:MAG: potassium/proton antiporter [Cytophagales bacterium]
MLKLPIEVILLICSILLFLSILLSKFTHKLGVPTLLGFLLLGLVFGNGGEYDFHYDYPEFTLRLGQIALSIILFTGGLNTEIEQIRPVMRQGLTLATVGVAITALVAGTSIYWLTSLDFPTSLLLGAIISSTDAAAVFSILEAKGMKLSGKIFPTLELESGTNDPMAYFLTISLSAFILEGGEFPVWAFLGKLAYSMGVGALTGVGMGYLTTLALRILKLKVGLTPVLVITIILFIFSLMELVGGNSLLAVYTAGIVFGNYKRNASYIANFFEGISWLMEIILFLTLGLQIFIQDLPEVFWIGMIVSSVLMFVARPISVFVSLAFFKATSKEKLYISWVGLRGATPIVFALYPVLYQVPEANLLFNISFFVVLTSILLQGSTISVVAKWLKVI